MKYEVDNLTEMGDHEQYEHDGPVFDSKDDASWYLRLAQSEDMTAWITGIEEVPVPE